MYARPDRRGGADRETVSNGRCNRTAAASDAFPSIRGPRRLLTGIPGSPPDLARPPSGCRFQPRCPVALPSARSGIRSSGPWTARYVRCLLYPAPAGAGGSGGAGRRAAPGMTATAEADRGLHQAAAKPLLRTADLTRHFRSAASSRTRCSMPSTTSAWRSGSARFVAVVGRERQRQEHARPTSRDALSADPRADLLPRPSPREPTLAPRRALVPTPGPDGLSGPVQLDQSCLPRVPRRDAQPDAPPARATRRRPSGRGRACLRGRGADAGPRDAREVFPTR